MKSKKIIVFCSSMLLWAAAFAGSSDFIIVDSETNRAYYSVSRTNVSKKTVYYDTAEVICNVQVYDILKKTHTYIFPDNTTYTVNSFFFEEKVDKKEQRKVFYANHAYYDGNSTPHWVKNNKNITAEKVSNNIVIETKNLSTKETQYWLCDKSGGNVRCVYTYGAEEKVRFYIDAKLQKLLFIHAVEAGNTVTVIDY